MRRRRHAGQQALFEEDLSPRTWPSANQDALFDDGDELFEVNPSKLQCYLDCARQYRFRYVDHRPERRAFAHTALGRSVHRALRDFFALAPDDRTLDVLLRMLRGAWDASGYRSQTEADAGLERAEEMLRRYYERGDHSNVRPLALESKFRYADPAAKILVTGRVDRLDAADDGYVIVDYKTGTFRQDPGSIDGSLPLSLYAMAVSAQLPSTSSRIVLEHLASGDRFETLRERERLERDWEALVGVVDEMRGDDRYPPDPGPLCRWCDYLSVCPAGRAEVGRRGGRG